MRADEWKSYALCGDQIGFILGPEEQPEGEVDTVVRTCDRCPVRVECMRDTLTEMTIPGVKHRRSGVVEEAYTALPSGVWSAGVWVDSEDESAAEESRGMLRGMLLEEERVPRD
jgi:hypothetical protein